MSGREGHRCRWLLLAASVRWDDRVENVVAAFHAEHLNVGDSPGLTLGVHDELADELTCTNRR